MSKRQSDGAGYYINDERNSGGGVKERDVVCCPHCERVMFLQDWRKQRAQGGGGFLALLTSSDTFLFSERNCHAVYIPTSPVPMSGGIVFVPVEKVNVVEMSVDELMQIYFSLGVMASKVVPEKYRAA